MDSTSTPNTTSFLVSDPNWAIDFAPNGTRLGLHDTMTRKRYADTLDAISAHGAAAFYSGPIANATIQALRSANGSMTLADLSAYRVTIRPPAQITYRGYQLTAGSAPCSGEVALSVLKTVEGYDGFGDLDPARLDLSTHRLDEAMRFAYGERSNLGDPSFVQGLGEYQAEMLNETTARRIRGEIVDTGTLDVQAYSPTGLVGVDEYVGLCPSLFCFFVLFPLPYLPLPLLFFFFFFFLGRKKPYCFSFCHYSMA